MKNTGRLLKKATNHMLWQFDQFAKQYHLTGTQMSIIDFIGSQTLPIYFQRDIEKEFNIQRSTTTVLLQGMEKKGLIFRRISPNDARQKSVHLTTKGLELVAVCRSYFQDNEASLQKHFSKQDLQTFEAILNFYLNNESKEHQQ
ncbi:MarR family winged helix-turn-helix transcriptional regulator [Streptococcus dentiloxodontae]